MKTEPNLAIKELRRTIGRTQSEFAAMIGASKDTVASWETGRNKLSPKFARRIGFATGVDGDGLLRGHTVVVFDHPVTWERKYTAEDFEAYRQTTRGRSDEAGAKHHLKHCQDALELLFMAATKASGGKIRYRLPAVLDSFIDWCDQTREDFKLGQLIDEELTKRAEEHKQYVGESRYTSGNYAQAATCGRRDECANLAYEIRAEAEKVT